jgi:hypothetical protein
LIAAKEEASKVSKADQLMSAHELPPVDPIHRQSLCEKGLIEAINSTEQSTLQLQGIEMWDMHPPIRVVDLVKFFTRDTRHKP